VGHNVELGVVPGNHFPVVPNVFGLLNGHAGTPSVWSARR
jgi:hypothetical protein